MPPTPKKTKAATEAQLEERAAARGYTIEKEDEQWYVAIGGTRYGPMASLEEVDEFLPSE